MDICNGNLNNEKNELNIVNIKDKLKNKYINNKMNDIIEKLNNVSITKNNNEQKKGLKRNTIDKYYTKKNIANECIELVKKNIIISKNDLIIEPSAGNGSFIDGIKTLSVNFKFYDLEPEHNEILKQNFLELNHENLKQENTNIHIIGNPPFGRQASLAIKFIKKCCKQHYKQHYNNF